MPRYLLINKLDGTVVSLEGTYLLNEEAIMDNDTARSLWDEWVATGSDHIATQIIEHSGVYLQNILENSGFGDLEYGNCISYSPRAIRDEIEALVYSNVLEDEDAIIAQAFDDDDLRAVRAEMTDNDWLWEAVGRELHEAIRNVIGKKSPMVGNPHKYKDSSNNK